MTSVTLVTSFSEIGWNQYAERMLKSAIEFLPPSIKIVAYYNHTKPNFRPEGRIEFIDNYSIAGGVRDFIARHGDDPKKWGKVVGQKDNFRHNVNSFAHKSYALYDAAINTKSPLLVWCDSDVEFFAEVPESFFEESLPYPFFGAFLERGERYHIETGFYILRTNHLYYREFLNRFLDYYKKDRFLYEREYHDAWLMTQLVREMRRERKIATINLAPSFIPGAGHPWMMSRLAEFSDHKKGNLRKMAGKSFVEDLRGIKRPEPYWRSLPSRKDLK